MDMKDKIALVTAAASGAGRAGALILARAVAGAYPLLGEEILNANRQTLLRKFALEAGQDKR